MMPFPMIHEARPARRNNGLARLVNRMCGEVLRMMRLRNVGRVALVGVVVAMTQVTVAQGVSVSTTRSVTPFAAAKKALFVKTDFPASWTTSPASTGNSPIPGSAQLAHCIGVPVSVVTSNPPAANSPEFDGPDHLLTVDDSVSVYASPQAARADFNSLANPKTPSCLTRVLNGSAKATLAKQFGATIVGSIVVRRVPAADLAAGGTNFTMGMQLKSQGVKLGLNLTLFDYVHGDEEQTVDLISVETGFPVALAKQLTTTAVSRLR